MNPILIFVILVLSIILFILYHNRHLNYWKKKHVPYIKPLPLVGNVLSVCLLRKQIGELLKEFYDRQKSDFFGIHIFMRPYLVVKSPELIKLIVTKDFDHFPNRTVHVFKEYDDMWAKFLFPLKNPAWKQLRSAMSPIFTTSKLRNMVKIMNESGDDLINHLIKHTKSEPKVEAKKIFVKYTTNVIASCAFGLDSNCFGIENGIVEQAGKDIFGTKFHIAVQQTCYFFFPSIVKLFKMRFIEKYVADLFTDIILTNIEDRKKTGFKRNDLIDIIIEQNQRNEVSKFDDTEVVAVAMNFFGAGLETSSTTMTFALYELALNLKVQQKLKDEIKFHLEQNSEVTYEIIQSMKYLDMVVSETIRKYPLLTFFDRECVEEYKIPDTDVVIEKGACVLIPVYGLHHDPQYYPDPESFDPERFSEENLDSRPLYSYLPFGRGPRFCIGERFGLFSTKIGIIKILSEFNVEKCKETPEKLKLNPAAFVTNPVAKVMLRFSHCPLLTKK